MTTKTTEARSASFVLAVHGGAGVIERKDMNPEIEREYRAGITAALTAGHDVLARGGTSLDAVVAAVSTFEDDPNFNAGRGASFTAAGTNELDACVMDGASLRAGAVTLVATVKNPVQLARLVMDKTRHVMLAGHGAETLAREHGLPIVEPAYFRTERRWNALQRIRQSHAAANPAITESDKHGTVGAVALDVHGNLAAATSTGGRANKLAGRVGDSPIVGAGNYASNSGAAVSCTGEGEYFMRVVAAYTVGALIELKGMNVGDAAEQVIRERLAAIGGRGGLIALDRAGRVAMPFSTPGMYRGVIRSDGVPAVMIFPE
jgi:beta-aspartyl-peptidase (threonine type)